MKEDMTSSSDRHEHDNHIRLFCIWDVCISRRSNPDKRGSEYHVLRLLLEIKVTAKKVVGENHTYKRGFDKVCGSFDKTDSYNSHLLILHFVVHV